MRGRISLGVLALVLAASQPAPAQGTKGFDGFKLVDKQGNISKPADYRDRYELLGTYTVLDPKGNQMHVTYASPGTAAYYRKTGKFPDGAVMVKEIFGTDNAKLTTGDAYWASGIKVWFVQIKDEKSRFPNNPLWGVFVVVAWTPATLGFNFYIRHFASYNRTYGALGAFVILMVWMYITSFIVLVGAEINSELRKVRTQVN